MRQKSRGAANLRSTPGGRHLSYATADCMFKVENIRILPKLGITHILVKNSGVARGAAKFDLHLKTWKGERYFDAKKIGGGK